MGLWDVLVITSACGSSSDTVNVVSALTEIYNMSLTLKKRGEILLYSLTKLDSSLTFDSKRPLLPQIYALKGTQQGKF